MVAMGGRRSSAADTLNQLMKRCVECPDQQPSCGTCPENETCSLKPRSCNACASTSCVAINSIPGQVQATPTSSTPIGGIVGGVIGGVAVLLGLTFVVWWFCIRKRKRESLWIPEEKSSTRRSATVRSRRTNSIASTVLTRASNIIQIAYIPGVTNRSAPETPDMPQRPSAYDIHERSTSVTPEPEQLLFMPSRDSTWSDANSVREDHRVSLTPSLARASVATTMYHTDAIVPPVPAQYAYQTQANMVSVRSGGNTPNLNGVVTPPIAPASQAQPFSGSSIVARNVQARPVEIKKQSSGTVPTLGNLAKRNSQTRTSKLRSSTGPGFSDEKEVLMTPSTYIDESPPLTSQLTPSATGGLLNVDTASASTISAVLPVEGLLARPEPTRQDSDSAEIQAMIQNAIMGASAATVAQRPELKAQDSGPFSDANEINSLKENGTPTP